MIIRNIIAFHISQNQTSDDKEIFKRHTESNWNKIYPWDKKKHVLLYTCIFTSFGYFNKHYEEIYECGKIITFEDMSPGITFIFL